MYLQQAGMYRKDTSYIHRLIIFKNNICFVGLKILGLAFQLYIRMFIAHVPLYMYVLYV